MQGEVRVTVIATGFDRAVPVEQPVPVARPSGAAGVLQLPDHPRAALEPGGASRRAGPARAAAAPAAGTAGPAAAGTPAETPEMEIPTFIRRQMD